MTSRLLEAFEQFLNDDGTPIADGQLRFLVAGSTGTTAFQDTFSDINLQSANANPLPIQASGRIPAVWVPDLFYRIRYERTDGTLIKEADYVGSPETQGQFGAWNNETVYTIDKIVYYSGKFYRSNVGGNQDKQPDISSEWSELDIPEKYNATVTYGLHKLVYDAGILYVSSQAANLNHAPATNPNWWQRVGGIPTWGSATTYAQYALAIDSNGVLQVSQQGTNLNHNPVGDSGAWWKPQWQTVDGLTQVKYLSGGGNLTAFWDNWLTDSNSYALPAASTVPANGVLVVTKPDKYRTNTPTVTLTGGDYLESSAPNNFDGIGLLTSHLEVIKFISNGSNGWRIG